MPMLNAHNITFYNPQVRIRSSTRYIRGGDRPRAGGRLEPAFGGAGELDEGVLLCKAHTVQTAGCVTAVQVLVFVIGPKTRANASMIGTA